MLVAGAGDLSSERVRGWVDDAGVWAPAAFVAISASLTVAFFPGPLLAGASGLLFGTALGFPLSLTAAVLGACAACVIARAVGRDAAERWQGRACWRCGTRSGGAASSRSSTPGSCPASPTTPSTMRAGLTTIRLPVFAGATALGAAPRAFAYTALGGSLDDLGSPETRDRRPIARAGR